MTSKLIGDHYDYYASYFGFMLASQVIRLYAEVEAGLAVDAPSCVRGVELFEWVDDKKVVHVGTRLSVFKPSMLPQLVDRSRDCLLRKGRFDIVDKIFTVISRNIGLAIDAKTTDFVVCDNGMSMVGTNYRMRHLCKGRRHPIRTPHDYERQVKAEKRDLNQFSANDYANGLNLALNNAPIVHRVVHSIRGARSELKRVESQQHDLKRELSALSRAVPTATIERTICEPSSHSVSDVLVTPDDAMSEGQLVCEHNFKAMASNVPGKLVLYCTKCALTKNPVETLREAKSPTGFGITKATVVLGSTDL
jgi:hypothetical protein